MVDQAGRDALREVLSGLTDRHGLSLVQITHYTNEAEAADRVVKPLRLAGQRAGDGRHRRGPAGDRRASAGATIIELDRVGTPMAKGPRGPRRRCAASRSGARGRRVLIHGGNGPAKSTPAGSWLVWITLSTALPGGRPAGRRTGRYGRGRVPGRPAAAAAAPRRPGCRCRSGLSPDDSRRVARRAGDRRAGRRVGPPRRIDQLSGGRCAASYWPVAGPPAAGAHPDEPLAGLGRGQSAGTWCGSWSTCAARPGPTVVISHDFVGLEEPCPRSCTGMPAR